MFLEKLFHQGKIIQYQKNFLNYDNMQKFFKENEFTTDKTALG